MNGNNRWRARASLTLVITVLTGLCGCAGGRRPVAPGRVLSAQEPEFHRAYVLYVPSHYRQAQRWLLVIICHDQGLFESPQRTVNDWKGLAEKEGFLLAAPDLRRPSATGTTKRPMDTILSEDEGVILSIIRSLRGAYSVDETRIFLSGRGAGALPALYVGLRHPDLCRAVSVWQPDFPPQWLEPCIPFLDPYQPVQVLYCPDDLLTRKAAESCIGWLTDHDLNVSTVQQPGVRRRDPAAVFSFASDVLRRQPLIRIQVRDDPADRMAVAFRLHTSLRPTKVQWEFGDGSRSSEQSPSHRYARPGQYTVSLAIWSSGDQPHRRQVQVRIPRVWLGSGQEPASP